MAKTTEDEGKRKRVDGVSLDKMRGVCDDLGMRVDENESYLKVYWPAHRKAGQKDSPYRLYLAKGKGVCKRVDLSGFGRKGVGTVGLEAPNGRVQAHLDLSLPEEWVLLNLHAALVSMSLLDPGVEEAKTKKERPFVAPKQATPSAGRVSRARSPKEANEAEDAKKAHRLEKIKEATKRQKLASVRAPADPDFVGLPDAEDPEVLASFSAMPKSGVNFF